MNFYSLNHKAPNVSFQEAVVKGIAPDRGLYFPETITPLPADFYQNIEQYSNQEIAFELIKQFVGDEIPERELKEIIADTLSFYFPLVEIEKDIFSLELFHGPTMAFKDVGARFMARCLSYFNKNKTSELTVLVATSGDTGGAVASGFLGVKGVQVVILYPSGKVSKVQEKQLTTLGQNIKALEVSGTFDDCQEMIKTAFLDKEITNKMQLTSANSINVARWLPQMFYFAFAYKLLKNRYKEIVFSIPSGNFGNICAGMMAQQLGLPIAHFIAATNVNRVVPNYMETGNYIPLKSQQTISNAMDVGNPSNFIRIQNIFNNDFEKIKEALSSYSFTDDETREAILSIYKNSGYITDPHGAVGFLGLKHYLKGHTDKLGIFFETAHPVKFLDVIEPVIKKKIKFPPQIMQVIDKDKVALPIDNYEQL
ncbi:MAG: threonine synthase, partial [Flavobacteriaceae bacterium]|nr:threonine synthase [Flavobacteriaceae bacterium]